jgi:hypothetical protein
MAQVCAEWAHADAHASHWKEEVLLLKQEMNWTFNALKHWYNTWNVCSQGQANSNMSDDMLNRLQVYAYKQANIVVTLAVHFISLWHPPLVASGHDLSWWTAAVAWVGAAECTCQSPSVSPPVAPLSPPSTAHLDSEKSIQAVLASHTALPFNLTIFIRKKAECFVALHSPWSMVESVEMYPSM